MNIFKIAAKKRLQQQGQLPEDQESNAEAIESETLLNELGEIIHELEQTPPTSTYGSAVTQKLKKLHQQHQKMLAGRCMTGPYN
ncbi:MAG: hypothetical protein IBX50_08970 [Marinospirillum sp.]|uniref:hypothetical protein n=1 Tax=Marinospirillum sp. TaxID=2183934 RepID=UPI0019F09233|nr:hypothetical protein [Marinospirillum sp.]MBE0506834.1 hypothetical protein [Marinospirillum sp.]